MQQSDWLLVGLARRLVALVRCVNRHTTSVNSSPVQMDPNGAFSCPIINPAGPSRHCLTAYVTTQELSCRDGEAAVDVVVTPAEFKPGTWIMSDRLRRPVGTITEVSPSLFTIQADANSGLDGMESTTFASLDSAMSAIAKCMKGECQLSSVRA